MERDQPEVGCKYGGVNPKEGLRVAILSRQVGSLTGKWHFLLLISNCLRGIDFISILQPSMNKGSVKNNLVEFALEFAVDLIDLIEQNRRNSELFRGLLRLKIG
jgi:hypothetical protein